MYINTRSSVRDRVQDPIRGEGSHAEPAESGEAGRSRNKVPGVVWKIWLNVLHDQKISVILSDSYIKILAEEWTKVHSSLLVWETPQGCTIMP